LAPLSPASRKGRRAQRPLVRSSRAARVRPPQIRRRHGAQKDGQACRRSSCRKRTASESLRRWINDIL